MVLLKTSCWGKEHFIQSIVFRVGAQELDSAVAGTQVETTCDVDLLHLQHATCNMTYLSHIQDALIDFSVSESPMTM